MLICRPVCACRGVLAHQVLLTQVGIFRELVNVRYSTRKILDVPFFRTSQWFWFSAAIIYSYGNNFSDPDRRSLITSAAFRRCLDYVDLTSLLLYSTLLIFTVLTLKSPYYRYQVSQLAWTIAIIVVTVVQVRCVRVVSAHGCVLHVLRVHAQAVRARQPPLRAYRRCSSSSLVCSPPPPSSRRLPGALVHRQCAQRAVLVPLPRLAGHLQRLDGLLRRHGLREAIHQAPFPRGPLAE